MTNVSKHEVGERVEGEELKMGLGWKDEEAQGARDHGS